MGVVVLLNQPIRGDHCSPNNPRTALPSHSCRCPDCCVWSWALTRNAVRFVDVTRRDISTSTWVREESGDRSCLVLKTASAFVPNFAMEARDAIAGELVVSPDSVSTLTKCNCIKVVLHISVRKCFYCNCFSNVLLRVYSAALVGTDGEKQSAKKDAAPKKDNPPAKTKMEQIFGFKKEDLTSWHNLVLLLNRPTDPASLGIFRCLFGELTQARLCPPWRIHDSLCFPVGLVMAIDVTQERGLSHLDYKYLDGAPLCRFPLFNFLQPLPLDWMYLVYVVMFLGTLHILIPDFSAPKQQVSSPFPLLLKADAAI